ncbi:MAG: hypothetical protein NXI24_03860 [bacterium]|nr:hypothetical protein [bacterium]
MNFKLSLLPAFIPLLFASHCATLFSDSNYDYSFESEPPGANVSILSGRNLIANITTPGTYRLDLNNNYNIRFELSGYETHALLIEKDVDLWILGNFCNFGVGLAIDALTGAIHKPSTSVIKWRFERQTGALRGLDGEDRDAIQVTLEFSGNTGRKVVTGFQMKPGSGEVTHRLADLEQTVY